MYRREKIADLVNKMNEEDSFIDSAESVKKRLYAEENIVTKEKEVRNVLKKDIGMRYRKLKYTTFQANSIRNLVLR